MTSLGQLATGEKGAVDALAEAFVVGPGIWSALVGADLAKKRQEVGKIGTHSIAVLKVGEQEHTHPMRTFVGKERAALVKATSFRFLADVFAKGKARPATEPERRFLYITIPFEIVGKPVTTVEVAGGVIMIVVVEDDRLVWIDSPNEYNNDGSLKTPVP
jgi:hypothetical protein